MDKMHLFTFPDKIALLSLQKSSYPIEMKNYYANDNLMRITYEDETNLLHIIENGRLCSSGAGTFFLWKNRKN